MSRREVGVAAILVLASLLARLPFMTFATFDEEAWTYQTARSLGRPVHHVQDLQTGESPHTRGFLWQHPTEAALFAMPARLGFEAWRWTHVLAAAAAAGTVFLILRGQGVRTPVATAVGAAIALHPFWAALTAFGLTDATTTSLFLLGLLAASRDQAALGGALFLTAVLADATAWLGLGTFFLLEWRHHVKVGEARWWPIRMHRSESAVFWALALSTGVILYGWVWLKVYVPYAIHPGFAWGNLELLAPSVWLYPAALAGLAHRGARKWCILALAYPVAHVGMALLFGEALSLLDGQLPGALLLLAIGTVVPRTRRPRVHWPRAAAVVMAGLALASGALVPVSPAKSRALQPVSAVPSYSLYDFYAFPRDAGGLGPLLREAGRADEIVLVDLPLGLAFHPLEGSIVKRTGSGPIESGESLLEPFIRALESPGTATLFSNGSSPLRRSVAVAYGACEQTHARDAWLVWGATCGPQLAHVREGLAATSGLSAQGRGPSGWRTPVRSKPRAGRGRGSPPPL